MEMKQQRDRPWPGSYSASQKRSLEFRKLIDGHQLGRSTSNNLFCLINGKPAALPTHVAAEVTRPAQKQYAMSEHQEDRQNTTRQKIVWSITKTKLGRTHE